MRLPTPRLPRIDTTTRTFRLIALALVAAVLSVVGLVIDDAVSGPPQTTVTAYFPQAVGLYPGSEVRILGVPVGTVHSVTPIGTDVRVVLSYDAHDRVPADATAAIVDPTIVSDRYVQLTPVYTRGPVMRSGAVIPVSRTEVPVELDKIFKSVNTLSVALGPHGANRNGALSRLIAVSARNLKGNGDRLHETFEAFGRLLGTLAGSSGNLFGTLRNLQHLSATLSRDNGGVVKVNNDLAQVSAELDGERSDLAAALADLQTALGQVASFVSDNRAELTSDVGGLASVTGTIVKERESLEEFLDDAPLALQNLALTYGGKYPYLDSRSFVVNSGNPDSLISPQCDLLAEIGVAHNKALGQGIARECAIALGYISSGSKSATPTRAGAGLDTVTGPSALAQLLGAGR